MNDPQQSPLDDLGLGEDDPFGEKSPLGDSDALDEAIAELQDVVDRDREMGPIDEGFLSGSGDGDAGGDEGLQKVVMSIPVQLDVVIGSAQMPVSELIEMEAGSVVTLDRRIGEPVDICVNGTKVASGEIQALEDDPGRLGIKILSVGQL